MPSCQGCSYKTDCWYLSKRCKRGFGRSTSFESDFPTVSCGHAPGRKVTVTKKTTRTKTRIIIVPAPTFRLERRKLEVEPSDDDFWSDPLEETEEIPIIARHEQDLTPNEQAQARHRPLFARHICPACPKEKSPRTNGKGQGCCLLASTKTLTKKRTVTTTITRFSVSIHRFWVSSTPMF